MYKLYIVEGTEKECFNLSSVTLLNIDAAADKLIHTSVINIVLGYYGQPNEVCERKIADFIKRNAPHILHSVRSLSYIGDQSKILRVLSHVVAAKAAYAAGMSKNLLRSFNIYIPSRYDEKSLNNLTSPFEVLKSLKEEPTQMSELINFKYVSSSQYSSVDRWHITEDTYLKLLEYMQRLFASGNFLKRVCEYVEHNDNPANCPYSFTSRAQIWESVLNSLSSPEEVNKANSILRTIVFCCAQQKHLGAVSIEYTLYVLKPETSIKYPHLEHEYLQETVGIADTYCLSVFNSSTAYRRYCELHSLSAFKLGVDLQHFFSDTKRDYYNALATVDLCDRQKFAALCRIVIWNHYAEEFGNSRAEIPVKAAEPTLDALQQGIELHLQAADAAFKIVENKMNTLTKYENQASATVNLIHGRPAEDYSEGELMNLIRKARQAQSDIADLAADSVRVKAKHDALEEDIKVYLTALDSLK